MDGQTWRGPGWALEDIRLEKDPDKEDVYTWKATVIASSEEQAGQVRAYFEAMVKAAADRMTKMADDPERGMELAKAQVRQGDWFWRPWASVLVFHCEDCGSPRWRVKVDADTGAIGMLQCRKCGAIYTVPAKPRLALRLPQDAERKDYYQAEGDDPSPARYGL